LALLLPACAPLAGAGHAPAGMPELGSQDPAVQAVENGASHKVSSTVANVHGYGAVPILRKALLWDGNGEDEVYGLGIEAHRYVADGFAFGMGLDASLWQQVQHDVFSLEVRGSMRWYPFTEGPVFLDLFGGWLQATEPVPTGGTVWNMVFGFGPGLDVKVGPGQSLLLGCLFHHTSNALGRENDRNPSQDEARFWVGYAWNF
jgi:hypothetical protein